MAGRRLVFTLAAALVLLPAALPAAPYLVKDLNTTPALSGEIRLSDRGIGAGVSYFAATDPAHGTELWRSDGTPGGTERLTDICAGRCSSLPDAITVHAGRVFFKANDGFSGDELWVSDGTPGSERRVRDLCPGSCSASPGPVEKVGARLLFFPSRPWEESPWEENPIELWQTDGTRDGTVRVKVICNGRCSNYSPPISIGEKALFIVSERYLWVTDGTAEGTRLHQVGAGNQAIRLIPSDGFAWMADSDGLWRTDGTAAGTFLLKRFDELAMEPGGEPYFYPKVLWHGLLFGILSTGEMIRSDGTPEGTVRFASFSSSSAVRDFAPLDSELLFQVVPAGGPSNGSVLWSTRGTADTTGPKLALETAEYPSDLTSLSGDRAVFLEGISSEELRLWVTDGTAAGTRQLAVPPLEYRAEFLATGDGRAFFVRHDPEYSLWITDGTEAGTHEVRDLKDSPGSSGPQQQAALGGKLVFSAMAPDESAPLYVSDGSAAGTGLLSRRANNAFAFFPTGDRLLFSASRPGGWWFLPNLWATDGTPAGTILVTKRTDLSNPALLSGQILFSGLSDRIGTELWKINRLTQAVHLVKDIDPFFVNTSPGSDEQCNPESSLPVPGVVVGGRLLLAADDGRSGRELWSSDGTPAGTVPLRDINPGREPGAPTPCEYTPRGPHRHDTGLSSDPRDFVLLGSVALFTADDGVRGRELWVTNGTSPGTRRLADLIPGRRGSAPHDLVRFQGRVYFLAANSGEGESLWRTDGSGRGTTRVLDLTLGGLPSWGRSLIVAAGRLFFTVYNETTGVELWTSTGEAGGTGLVADLNPGPAHSSAQFLTAIGGVLLFTADDGLTGLEPWRTDGTVAGTVRVGDIAPGRDASSPGPFTALPTLVMTGADDGAHGRELWAIPKSEIVQSP